MLLSIVRCVAGCSGNVILKPFGSTQDKLREGSRFVAAMSLLDVKALTKAFTNEGVVTTALRDVSFTVAAGEFLAIMGPSGSGKSTLLHILGFLDRPTHGQYHFDGQQMEVLTDDERARIRNIKVGFVFQMFNLLSRVTVLENVKLPLVYAEVPEPERTQRAREVLEHLGLSHRLTYVPSQLSGGERQRVAIARALVNNPRIIFADEPTGNLDSVSGQAVLEAFERLHARGHTIILVTHETYTAEHAERILRLRDGQVESDTRVDRRRASGAVRR